jgi:hypothetical protein
MSAPTAYITYLANGLPKFDHAAHEDNARAADAARAAWSDAGFPESGAVSDAVFTAYARLAESHAAQLTYIAAIAKCRGSIR